MGLSETFHALVAECQPMGPRVWIEHVDDDDDDQFFGLFATGLVRSGEISTYYARLKDADPVGDCRFHLARIREWLAGGSPPDLNS